MPLVVGVPPDGPRVSVFPVAMMALEPCGVAMSGIFAIFEFRRFDCGVLEAGMMIPGRPGWTVVPEMDMAPFAAMMKVRDDIVAVVRVEIPGFWALEAAAEARKRERA